MRVNYLIDWLRYTTSRLLAWDKVVPDAPPFEVIGETIKPSPFYTHAAKMRTGRIDWHSSNEAMPHMVTLSGQDMTVLRRGTSERELLNYALSLRNVKVTRLDFAIDVYEGFTASDFEVRVKSAGAFVAAKKITVIDSQTSGKPGGKTVYIGSRQSEKMLRVYDKGLHTREQDKTGEQWTRVELEAKGSVATKLARNMVMHGVAPAGCGAIRQFVNIPTWREWTDILSGAVEVDLAIGAKSTNHEQWLIDVVYPNFERALREGNPEALRLLALWADEYAQNDF